MILHLKIIRYKAHITYELYFIRVKGIVWNIGYKNDIALGSVKTTGVIKANYNELVSAQILHAFPCILLTIPDTHELQFKQDACEFLLTGRRPVFKIILYVKVKVAQLCLTLCDSMDSPWNSLGQNTGLGSLSLLQEIFPTQGSNRALLHCRQIFYQLRHRQAQEYWSG